MKTLILFLFIMGCTKQAGSNNQKSEYYFKRGCVDVGSFFDRCENKEVICYTFGHGYGAGISCKFKGGE